MKQKRRDFIKSVAAIPMMGVPVAAAKYVEPDKWVIEDHDWGYAIGIGAVWGSHRHAVICYHRPLGLSRQKAIEIAKNSLRQWYLERNNEH